MTEARIEREYQEDPNATGLVQPERIHLWPGQMQRAIDEVYAAISRLKKPIFQRAGCLVMPIWDEYPTADGRRTRINRVVQLDVHSLRYNIAKRGIRFTKTDGRRNVAVPVDAPPDLMMGVLGAAHFPLPRLDGVASAPSMRADGYIIRTRGFDETTGVWFNWEDGLELPPIVDAPSKDQAAAAKKLLLRLLSGFEFADKNLDLAVAFAAILTAVLRPALDLAPMFLITAPSSGTGKSHLVNVVSAIITGRDCPVMTLNGNNEEVEKRLGSVLLEAPPIISFDNLTKDLNHELLCQICSQRMIKTRILGRSETPSCEWRGLPFATGNNVSFSGDMIRRGAVCNMDTRRERPELRSFEFDPVKEIQKNRGAYVGAVLTIVSAYLNAEATNCRSFAGYDSWSHMVRGPMFWLDMADPLDAIEVTFTADNERVAARELYRLIWEAAHDNKPAMLTFRRFTAADLVAAATAQDQTVMAGEPIWLRPELRELLFSECCSRNGTFIDARQLGRWLNRIQGQVHVGYRVEKIRENTSGHCYRVIAV